MSAVPFNPFMTYFSAGVPLNGGKIYTYAPGTTTPVNSYTDGTGSTAATNPIILNSDGKSPYGAIWLSGNYKLVLTDSTGAVISTDDNVSAFFGTGDMVKSIYDPANISQQVVGVSALQSVSNKTLVTPNITGDTTGADAAAGSVGEWITSQVLQASAVTLSNNTGANVTSISLTAGDYDIGGNVNYNISAGSTITYLAGAGNLTSATLPTNLGAVISGSGLSNAFDPAFSIIPQRIKITVTSTLYLVAQSGFSAGTIKAYGNIWARRRR